MSNHSTLVNTKLEGRVMNREQKFFYALLDVFVGAQDRERIRQGGGDQILR